MINVLLILATIIVAVSFIVFMYYLKQVIQIQALERHRLELAVLADVLHSLTIRHEGLVPQDFNTIIVQEVRECLPDLKIKLPMSIVALEVNKFLKQ